MERLIGLIGIAVLFFIAFAMSNNKRNINWKLVFWGITLQLLFALFILKTPVGQPFFGAVDTVVKRLLSFSIFFGVTTGPVISIFFNPALTNTSASETFATQTPIAPVSICLRARAEHLCVLT